MDIQLRNITKSFGRKKVIEDLSMDISSGSFTTLLGPSGCGKTTLLRMIAGLETLDLGEIFLGGRPVFSADKKLNIPPEKRGLGFVFQDFALWPHMKVRDNVAFALKACRMTAGLERKVQDARHAVQHSLASHTEQSYNQKKINSAILFSNIDKSPSSLAKPNTILHSHLSIYK